MDQVLMKIFNVTFKYLFFVILSFSTYANVCIISISKAPMFPTSLRRHFLTQGIILSFEEHKQNWKDYIFETDGSEISLIEEINKAIKKECKIIIGMGSSKECLIAGPSLLKNKIFGFSPTCGHENISNFYPYLFTGVPSLQQYAKAITSFINKKSKSHQIVLIKQKAEVYSTSLYNSLTKALNKNYISIEFSKDGKPISDVNINSLNKRPYFFVFTTYPLISVEITNFLKRNGLINKQNTLIGSPSWIFDLNLLAKSKDDFLNFNEALVPNLWDSTLLSKTKFYKSFMNHFHSEPHNFAIYSYEISNRVLNCLNNNNFLDCYKNYQGKGETGSFTYTETSFPKRKINLYDLNRYLK